MKILNLLFFQFILVISFSQTRTDTAFAVFNADHLTFSKTQLIKDKIYIVYAYDNCGSCVGYTGVLVIDTTSFTVLDAVAFPIDQSNFIPLIQISCFDSTGNAYGVANNGNIVQYKNQKVDTIYSGVFGDSVSTWPGWILPHWLNWNNDKLFTNYSNQTRNQNNKMLIYVFDNSLQTIDTIELKGSEQFSNVTNNRLTSLNYLFERTDGKLTFTSLDNSFQVSNPFTYLPPNHILGKSLILRNQFETINNQVVIVGNVQYEQNTFGGKYFVFKNVPGSNQINTFFDSTLIESEIYQPFPMLLENGHLIILGRYDVPNAASWSKRWGILKLYDKNNKPLIDSSFRYFENRNTELNQIIPISNDTYILIGQTADLSTNQNKIFLKKIKLKNWYLSSVGINEKTNQENKFLVYPNPANSTIKIEGHLNEIQEMRLTDIHGKVLIEKSVFNQVDISKFPNGVYILNIKMENGKTETHKIIK